MSNTEKQRAKFELQRRLRARSRRAAGLPTHPLNGSTGPYNIPSRETVNKGVEKRRSQHVTVTLPKLNLPELGDES